jgi:hypothetical protein
MPLLDHKMGSSCSAAAKNSNAPRGRAAVKLSTSGSRFSSPPSRSDVRLVSSSASSEIGSARAQACAPNESSKSRQSRASSSNRSYDARRLPDVKHFTPGLFSRPAQFGKRAETQLNASKCALLRPRAISSTAFLDRAFPCSSMTLERDAIRLRPLAGTLGQPFNAFHEIFYVARLRRGVKHSTSWKFPAIAGARTRVARAKIARRPRPGALRNSASYKPNYVTPVARGVNHFTPEPLLGSSIALS